MKTTEQAPMQWLMGWYQSHCDGDWEHQYGIRIETLDNPGWMLEVDLVGTVYAGLTVAKQYVERSDHNWISVQVDGNSFRSFGGPGNLLDMIEAFRAFTFQVPG